MNNVIDRREFVHAGFVTVAALSPLRPLIRLATTGSLAESVGRQAPAPVREVQLMAEPGEVEVAPGRRYSAWLFNGRFPGPDLRVREGERLRVTLENRLPEGTTVHWHGVPVPNSMDGVPGLTQDAVPPGGRFVYEFPAAPAGSYVYHSHVGLQLDRGLLGPLVIEEREPHVGYDRDYTVVLDDLLPGEPRPAAAHRRGMMGDMRSMMGRGGMMTADPARPAYAALLINGRAASDPPSFEVRRGERVRLRLMNLASATLFRVALAGHRLTVTHTDGRPVRPVKVDAVVLGMGERYDVVVEANNPGAWPLAAASLDGTPAPARAILRYTDAAPATPPADLVPEGLVGGRVLSLDDLIATEAPPARARVPDRTFELTLSGGMMMSAAWTINRQAYPDADPLDIRGGELIRVRLTNMSMAFHPMHLHGHFFRVGAARKDTVVVQPHMGRVVFDFVADNPGKWFFHCHNLYHMEGGMARVFRYV